ncbi:DUF3572 family protein [Allosphingosinicella indica]|uniref:DUF3572 family protein n=1 Tax=Allosphingosinicella indica TaxID=941907 RepID=A0A1X7FZG4_9SPHN|nr:DUF3572 family protein [Allosphingosinicella indica]SMF61508.1 Protein of unknown function [Allosphingosinicella indica]
MTGQETNEAETVALGALGWTLADDARAERLLALTGLDAGELRARIGEPALLAAVLAFLEAHEPDLIACADAIGRSPADLAAARRVLEA